MNWKAIQQLHELYQEGRISSEILKYSYIERQVEMERILKKGKLLVKTDLFDDFYERKHLDKFERIKKMLIQYELVTSTNFKENDLEALLKIEEGKEKILDKEFSQKEIATRYFDDSKYIKTGTKLHEAILKILDIETLRRDEHDQQFLYILHCQSKNPTEILLCENINLLEKSRLKNTELWFAGGSNTAKLAYVPTPQIPIYYLCDWDNKGIEIYQRIKRDYFPDIKLVVPKTPKYLPIVSEWKTNIDESLFTESALYLLKHLMENNLYIIEEGIDDYTSCF